MEDLRPESVAAKFSTRRKLWMLLMPGQALKTPNSRRDDRHLPVLIDARNHVGQSHRSHGAHVRSSGRIGKAGIYEPNGFMRDRDALSLDDCLTGDSLHAIAAETTSAK
ncbi:MAG: hypothetical protein U1E25_11500 [Methylocystis sp.]